MSLRVVPLSAHPSQATNTTGPQHLTAPYPTKGAPSVPGLPDILRNNIALPAPAPPSSSSSQIAQPASTHPLEARLLAWRATNDGTKMETLRRMYGMAEPIRRGMELKIVRGGNFRPQVLGGPVGGNIHEDILALGGRDCEVAWEDVFKGDEFREPPSFHDEMEKRLRMD
ncbi:hypothetical protein Egran_04558 [Elaphomyces granulatus]|uniref:Proteasome maturation factor UMP1 n=1 Tax=Elaphomyces granulatus TaxID=519963 RepID=A0A232LU41_9EURO|nr:hypothetical protein Egran_04558 [Elaphomyces granulatus]